MCDDAGNHLGCRQWCEAMRCAAQRPGAPYATCGLPVSDGLGDAIYFDVPVPGRADVVLRVPLCRAHQPREVGR